MEELEYITQKAMMQCSDGAAPGLFTPNYNTKVKISCCLVATAMDKNPLVNIPSFVVCSKTQKPCMPAPTMWQDTYPVKVKGQPTLLGKSCIQCGIGGKIEFLTSGQIPLTAEEEAELENMRNDVQDAHEKEMKEKNKPWWQKAGEFAIDLVPVVGPVVSMVRNVSEGNWGMAALDVGFLALDIVGLVAAPVTGGASVAGATVAKAGIKAGVKAAAKAAAKKCSKEAIQAGVKKTGEILSKISVRNMSKGKLCVFACFPAGTPVATRDGYKNIEDIEVGDEVWAWDETSGTTGLQKVTGTLERTVNSLVELTINGETIQCTPDHPFLTNGEWKEAGLLDTGDRVKLFTANQEASVEKVIYAHDEAIAAQELLLTNSSFDIEDIGNTDEETSIKVFNLEVGEWGTYFVGQIKALVHNATGVCLKGAAAVFRRSKSERAKALLRDARDPNSGLSQSARDFIIKHNGKKVPKGHEVSHEIPLYTARTAAGKRSLDKAGNMRTQRKADHRRRHKQCGDQFHEYGPANKPRPDKIID